VGVWWKDSVGCYSWGRESCLMVEKKKKKDWKKRKESVVWKKNVWKRSWMWWKVCEKKGEKDEWKCKWFILLEKLSPNPTVLECFYVLNCS